MADKPATTYRECLRDTALANGADHEGQGQGGSYGEIGEKVQIEEITPKEKR